MFALPPSGDGEEREEREILNEITQSYLFRNILAYGNIEKPDVLEKILRALAFQVGNEVSYNEIGQLTGVDKNTAGQNSSRRWTIFRRIPVNTVIRRFDR